MFEDFKTKHKDFKCSYELYRKEIQKMRISFTKLGEEGCEICEEFHMNERDHDHAVDTGHLQGLNDENEIANLECDKCKKWVNLQGLNDENEIANLECDKCKKWVNHINAAKMSRRCYQDDVADADDDNKVIRSVDLQKVIMLPRMPGNKTAVFTRRLTAYHETFASVGKKTKRRNKEKTISVLWHEGITGRNQEDIISTFCKALEHERDKEHIIYWMDNCSSQNKNWCLYSALVAIINSDIINSQDITLKYFERGHTFMSADSVHHGVEKEMAAQPGGNIYDFADFVRVVSSSNSGNIDVIQLNSNDVRAWVTGHSVTKLKSPRPMLADIEEIQVRRDSKLLYFKTSHDDDEFQSLDFLKKNHSLELPQAQRKGNIGISQQKKTNLVEKLCPLMPQSRRSFWNNLTVSNHQDSTED